MLVGSVLVRSALSVGPISGRSVRGRMFEGPSSNGPHAPQAGASAAETALVASFRLPGLGRPLGDERGFTMVEVLVTALVGLIIFGAVMQMLVIGQHQESGIDTRSYQLQSARVGEEALARDLRQATAVSVPSTSSIQYTLPSGTVVTWACGTGTCLRTPNAGASKTMIGNVTNTSIFTLSSNYVTISLSVGSSTRAAVTINDGIALRNLTQTSS
jgi:prepilin-type N-terminal cleavage/methylation domain-containing protein